MLSDRTYLLFKPRSNLPNDRLNIRQDNSSPYSSLSSSSASTYRVNPLTHSSSYERLSSKPFSSTTSSSGTPLPKRKYLNSSGLTSASINNSIYDQSYDFSLSNDYNAPRRRTGTFSHSNAAAYHTPYHQTSTPSYSSSYDRKPLQRSDSYGSSLSSSLGLYEKSSNMEKREILMSSFNRHTNTGPTWMNRLKLSNLFNSPPKKTPTILPPRPSSNYYSNYSKSSYSPYKTGPYRTNYLMYDDYYRPRIRERPSFSDIRKSVMHKGTGHQLKNPGNRYYANTPNNSYTPTTNNYSNKFNKNAVGMVKSNASVLSNGSSGGLSSSSSGGSISYTQQSTTTTSPSETPAFSSPLQSQKSIRKVDRYRSVIKFREHNIGKTYEERKNTINWDIENEEPFANSELLSKMKELATENVDNKIEEPAYAADVNDLNNLNKEMENIWNVITDTTLLTHTSSTNTLSDMNVGYEPTNTEEINKLEQQFAEIKRKKDELEKLKTAVENDNLLNTGRRKLHKSVSLEQEGKDLSKVSKKSKSVKINANLIVKDIKSDELVEQVSKERPEDKIDIKMNGEKDVEQGKEESKMKKILKTSKTLVKKQSKVKMKDEEQDVNNNVTNKAGKTDKINKDDEKFKNKHQSFKTLFVKPEIYFTHCHQGFKKSKYSKPEVHSVSLAIPPMKTPFCKLELERVEKKTKLIKTDFYRLELVSVSKSSQLIKTDFHRLELVSVSKSSPLIKTEFEGPKIQITLAKSDPIKTDYQSPRLIITKLTTPLIKTHYFKPTIVSVELQSDLIKTNYISPILHKASTKLGQFKTSYRRPELQVVQVSSPLLKTEFHHLKLEQTVLTIPNVKTNYERLEWFVTKPVSCALLRTDFQSPVVQVVQVKSKLIKTDYVHLPVQAVVKVQDLVKSEYFRVPVEVVQLKLANSKTNYTKVPIEEVNLKLGNIKTDYSKVPIEEVNVKLDYFEPLDYQRPYEGQIINQTAAKPPLHISVKNQLNRAASRKSLTHLASENATTNQLINKSSASLKSEQSIGQSAIKSTLSSIKSVLSLNNESNDLKKLENKEQNETTGKKVKKVKKVKVAKKASSISGSNNNENKVPKIIDTGDVHNQELNENVNKTPTSDCPLVTDKKKLLSRSASLDHEQNGQNDNTFHNAIASKEQYRLPQKKRIKFRNYNINDFYLQSVLGRGSFGKVFLAELRGHEVFFAIKCLKKNVVIEDNDVESTMIERKVLALGSSNPFICKLFCTFQTPSYLCFAMEYLAGGDLMFHVQKNGRFEEDRARFYAAEIVCALRFLHRRYIIYRDLKLDNILLDKDGHIRLVDFGMCQLKIYRQECLPSNFCGTPDYMAPEIVKGVKYNHSVDWWSFGVLLYEMLIGKSPFTGADEDELLWNVCNEKIIFSLFLSKESVHIIALLLNRNADKRLGMPGCPAGDITQQAFFSDTNWQFADAKLLPPPFIPDLSGPNDIQFFDKEFTEAEPALTPVDDSIVNDLNHDLFDGFDYTNPSLTD